MKTLKKFIAFLTVLSVVLPPGLVFASSFDDDFQTEKPVYKPVVKLLSPTVIEVNGGATQTVEISLKNTGSGSAQNVVVQANITEDSPFTVSFPNKSNNIASITNNSSKKLNLQIKVDKTAPSGSYPLTLKYSYKNQYNDNFTETDTIMVRVENTTLGPDLRLYDFSVDKNAVASGDAFKLTAIFENISTQTAYDATVNIEGLDPEGIYLSNSAANAYIKTFNMGTKDTITFDLRTSPKAKKGTYALTFKVTYKDNTGKDYEKEYTYYVTIGSTTTSEDEKGDVQIINVTAPTQTFQVGSEFTISMDVINKGNATAKNVKITAVNDEGGGVVPKTANIRMLHNLAPEQSEHVEFKFSPTSSAKSQNYTIGFTLEYETGEENDDGTPEKIVYSQYAGVNVFNPEEEEKDEEKDNEKISIPKIIVSEYKVEPQIVSAGQEFDLDLSFLNTHGSKSIENIKAFLVMEDKSTAADTTEDKGNVFSPVNGSNTFYIDKIGPKGETKKHLRLFCIPDASAKTYTISVKFEYQDSEFNQYTEEALIGITVKQSTRLETSEISLQTDAEIGSPLPISFQLYNMGKVTLSNLMVSIDAPGFDTVSTESTVYFGKFNPSDSNYYDGVIIPQESGDQKVKVVISYEDDAAEKHEVTRDFDVVVNEGFVFDDDMMYEMNDLRPGMDQSRGSSVGAPVIIGIVIAVAAIAGGGAFLYKKKKQKGMDFDE